jgi:hypothetical protein
MDCRLSSLAQFLHPPVLGESINSREFVGGSKVSVTSCHFDVLMACQLLYRPQINSGHHQLRNVCVPENVPGHIVQGWILLDGFFHHEFKPRSWRDHRLTISGEANLVRVRMASFP